MTKLDIKNSSIEEFGVYDEDGAIVFGILVVEMPARSIIIQIDSELSKVTDAWGMHVEIDKRAFYGGTKTFRYLEDAGIVELGLDAAKSGGIESISIQLPSGLTGDDRQLIRKMARNYADYPPVRELPSRRK
jgi:hypothetical protein